MCLAPWLHCGTWTKIKSLSWLKDVSLNLRKLSSSWKEYDHHPHHVIMGGGSATIAQWKTSVLPSSSWWLGFSSWWQSSLWCEGVADDDKDTNILWQECLYSWMIGLLVQMLIPNMIDVTLARKSCWYEICTNIELKILSRWNIVTKKGLSSYRWNIIIPRLIDGSLVWNGVKLNYAEKLSPKWDSLDEISSIQEDKILLMMRTTTMTMMMIMMTNMTVMTYMTMMRKAPVGWWWWEKALSDDDDDKKHLSDDNDDDKRHLSDGRFLWESGGSAVHLWLGGRVHGCKNICHIFLDDNWIIISWHVHIFLVGNLHI